MLMQQGDSIPRQVSVSLGKDELLTYPAQLDYLSPNVDLNTGTLNIRARLDNPKGVLIRAGITPRERYVTKALMKVRDGMKVHPIDN